MRDVILELLIGIIVIALGYWAIGALPLPGVIEQVAIVLLVVLAVLWAIDILLAIMGRPRFLRRAP